MKTATIINDFHHTEATCRPGPGGQLTKRQVQRLQRILCGISDCQCSGDLGQRGHQDYEIETLSDGGAILREHYHYDDA